MGNILDIISGHTNELFNKNEELFETRIKICKECPLYLETALGPICNSKLYINAQNEVSDTPKDGFKRGCSCLLMKKSRLQTAKCIIGKW